MSGRMMIGTNILNNLKAFAFWLYKPKKYKFVLGFIRFAIYIFLFYCAYALNKELIESEYSLILSVISIFFVTLTLEMWAATNERLLSLFAKFGSALVLVVSAYFVDRYLDVEGVVFGATLLICAFLYFLFGPVPPKK